MGPIERVTDPGDPRLRDFTGLTDVQRRTKLEPEFGIFIAEGELIIQRALRAGYPLESVLLYEEWLGPLSWLLEPTGATVYVADRATVEAVTGFHVHRGALGSFRRLPPPDPDEVLGAAHRVVLLESVVNPTNLGVIVRSAAGLGMDAVVLDPRCCDPLYRRSVRVSMGEVFAVPLLRLQHWPADLQLLRRHGFRTLALTPDPAARPLDQLAFGAAERVALLLGSEGPGLSETAMAHCDLRVRIPMAAGVDSLNVGAAAAVACYAVGRRPGSGGAEPAADQGDRTMR